MNIKNLVGPISLNDYNEREVYDEFDIMNKIARITAEVKGRTYKNSWCKRGELLSAYSNFTRKSDRIENIMEAIAAGEDVDLGDEGLVDLLIDIKVYVTLWLTMISAHRPNDFKSWLSKNKEVADKLGIKPSVFE